MNLRTAIFTVLFMHGTYVFAAEDHTQMMNHGHSMNSTGQILTEAGNDAFGTIQEVIRKLNSDPNTDWSKVNIEALRQHLLDMNDMTLNVEVLSQKPVQNGMEAIIMPTTARAALALERVLSAHPVQLKYDTGWEMKVEKIDDQYRITTTSKKPADAAKIRGLGYIGLMAYGDHHQRHHWAMATGKNPHK